MTEATDAAGAAEPDLRILDHARDLAASLISRAGDDPDPLLADALSQLETAHEELAVSMEELHEQHRDLLEARGMVEAERQHFENIFDGAPDAYVLTDAHGVIQRANTHAHGMLAMAGHLLAGRPIAMMVVAEDRGAFRRRLLQAAEGTPQRDWVVAIKPTHRAAILLSADVAPGTGVDGEVELRWVLRDVTHARQAQEALQTRFMRSQEEAETLREMDRWKDAFMAAAAHDLRSPLAVIASSVETLRARPGLDGERRDALIDSIGSQAGRLRRLLDDLLDLDRYTRGKVAADRVTVDVADLVRRTVGAVAMDDHPVTVDVSPLRADVDVMRVEQILTNLLRNAVQHTPAGTPVQVSVACVEDRMVVLSVEDEGPGLPAGLGDEIFAPFVTQATHASSPRGTGIGLSLVRLFAELHGGEVRAEPREGGGTRFVVELPATIRD